jgi:hypothetical protein
VQRDGDTTAVRPAVVIRAARLHVELDPVVSPAETLFHSGSGFEGGDGSGVWVSGVKDKFTVVEKEGEDCLLRSRLGANHSALL